MILRRVIEHVRNQQWTAIAIDLIIVVVGVYIGIQAQTWNSERQDRVVENRYLNSLHDEVTRTIDEDKSRVEYHEGALMTLEQVTAALSGDDETSELGKEHCDAIAASHIYVGYVSVPPTIEELLSTGRLQLIESDSLRSHLVTFFQDVASIHHLIADIQSDRAILSREYPELITLDLNQDGDGICDFAKMAESAGFLNDLADNRSRYRAYVDDAVVGQQEDRIELHKHLDEALGISHAPVTPE